jgi:hypothetical protein
MAAKKKKPVARKSTRKSKVFLKRSKAAKKEWATRRAKAAEKVTLNRITGDFDTRDWVYASDLEYVRMDGTLAVEPTLLRRMGKLTEHLTQKLKAAQKQGEATLAMQVKIFAEHLQIDAREFYTLLMSP